MNAKIFLKSLTMKRLISFFCYLFKTSYFFVLFSQSLFADLRILDADTIEISGNKVRLNGIDAPETSQRCKNGNQIFYNCGKMATTELKKLVSSMPDKAIKCTAIGTDEYGRIIGDCTIGQININSWLVRSGWALAYRNYSMKYVEDEEFARTSQNGVWNPVLKKFNTDRGMGKVKLLLS